MSKTVERNKLIKKEMLANEKIFLAYKYAEKAHEEVKQFRKYTNEKYIIHPLNVAALIFAVEPNNIELIQAALLHDVVEDTNKTINSIEQLFGKKVAQYTLDVTNVATKKDGDRKFRVAKNLEHLKKSSKEGKTIKIADMIDNLSSLEKFDPIFAKKYFREKRLALPLLKNGNNLLLRQLESIIEDYFK